MPRVIVIGLDCLTPQLVFDAYRGRLFHLEALAAAGLAGPLRSSVPPITVPAWACMTCGVDPGMLGVYGFHDRADRSYDRRRLASSAHRGEPVWEILARHGLRSRLIGVPQTYPPRAGAGPLIAGIPMADGVPCVFPAALQAEVDRVTGGYRVDVEEFRTTDREAVRDAVYDMTRRRFALARAWLTQDDWDFFMLVEMGPDRMHHAFWRFAAPDHPAYTPGHPYEHVIRDYYVALDREVGVLLALARADDVVLVVSDHGARTLHGGIALNDWLIAEGHLVLHERPPAPTPFSPDLVDWPRTTAWADGGYVGRVYLNVRGREPQGLVPMENGPRVAAQLAQDLCAIAGASGRALATRVFFPGETYRALHGVPPDLMVYFDDLALRAVGSVGHRRIHVPANDTGPDDANHAEHGIIILRDGCGPRSAPTDASLYDVAPTLLARLGLPIPPAIIGRALY